MEISELQKDLAAVFRWTARLNMNEGIANHFSACIPNSNDFYVNGSGMHFASIKASDMVLVKQNMIEEIKKKTELVDPTALNIHGAIHKKVPHARCILHVHSKYATALSTLKNPTLEPIDQNTMRFYNRIAIYDDFGGLGFEEESNKMAAAIGNNRSMLLANHGILTVGETVAEAFDELYYFEKACETYITALSTNKELNLVEPKIAEKTAQEWENYPTNMGEQHLKAIRLILDNEDSDYKN
jgi:ribulose-5-phosphate 4-epimerase/fuculose-1-phosphate aldolase